MNDKIANLLANLPDHPGVYRMYDQSHSVIYVGKAKSLKNRVRQYFQNSGRLDAKVQLMVDRIHEFDYILTNSETEALALESNLIKKNRPQYNIRLKDDKHFPYIRIRMGDPFPKLEVVRRVGNDGARYVGPFIGAYKIRDAMETARKIFPMRTCNNDTKKFPIKTARPCLNYQIGQCVAPCCGKTDREAYRQIVEECIQFLSGAKQEVTDNLRRQMEQASYNLQYEKAALLRDRIAAVEGTSFAQKAIDDNPVMRDVIGLALGLESATAQMFYIRHGKIIGNEYFTLLEAQKASEPEVLSAFLMQYYGEQSDIPPEILLPWLPDEAQGIEQWLSEKRKRRVRLLVPKRGEKKKLVDLAVVNATEELMRAKLKQEHQLKRTQGALEALAAALALESPPWRIEGYDISNTMGQQSVASMVVFEGGKPARDEYRRFRIKTVEGANDFASIAEVIGRRLDRYIQAQPYQENVPDKGVGFAKKPDLIMIDGGKGQLAAAMEAQASRGVSFPMIGLAKRFEEIYLPDRREPLRINSSSPALQLLQHLRDEAHRYAITYHRSLRSKKGLHSLLEDIPGIGPKKRIALLHHFASIEQIEKASLEQLIEVEGLSPKNAEAIQAYFQQQN